MNRCFNVVGNISKKTGLDISFNGGTPYVVMDEETGNWEVNLLNSGVLTFNKDPGWIDVCLIGGGGCGSVHAGGGGGYVTNFTFRPERRNEYEIYVGAGAGTNMSRGGSTYAFGEVAEGGYSASAGNGGDGCCGGGGSAKSGGQFSNFYGGNGGSYGQDGENGKSDDGVNASERGGIGGKGTGYGTGFAFGEAWNIPCSGGGGGWPNGLGGDGGGGSYGNYGVENTGGGGGAGGIYGLDGGSGRVIFRNYRGNDK